MENTETPLPVRESAAYGRACVGCSKAKCKCILRGRQSDGCERCHRLQQPCRPSAMVRKRKQDMPKATRRTDLLEERLDDLVKLLSSQANGHVGLPQSRTAESVASDPSSHPASTLYPSGSESQLQSPGLATPATQSSHNDPHPTSCPEPSQAQAEEYLRYFRDHQLRMFPFYHIHSGITVEYLKRERPLTWLCIRANCSKSMAEQRALETRIRETFARALIVDLDRNFDMLLGIIIYVTWTQEKFQGRPLLSLFSNLAMTLLVDLNMNRNIQEYPCREVHARTAYSHPIKQVYPTKRTNEERRVILACYITSAYVATFLKSAPPHWTGHMEDCLQHLVSEPEDGAEDALLVAMTRLWKLHVEVYSISTWKNLDTPPTQFPPQMVHVKGLLSTLREIQRVTPAHLLENSKIIKCHVYMVESLINELPLYPLERTLSTPTELLFDRTECFYACLQALKKCIECASSYTAEEIYSLPGPCHLHYSRCSHILYRLSLLEDSAWDRRVVSETVDLLGIVQRNAQLYKKVPAVVGLDMNGGADIFTTAADIMEATIPVWRRTLVEAGAIPPTAGGMDLDPGQMTGVLYENMFDTNAHLWVTDMFSFGDSAWSIERV